MRVVVEDDRRRTLHTLRSHEVRRHWLDAVEVEDQLLQNIPLMLDFRDQLHIERPRPRRQITEQAIELLPPCRFRRHARHASRCAPSVTPRPILLDICPSRLAVWPSGRLAVSTYRRPYGDGDITHSTVSGSV